MKPRTQGRIAGVMSEFEADPLTAAVAGPDWADAIAVGTKLPTHPSDRGQGGGQAAPTGPLAGTAGLPRLTSIPGAEVELRFLMGDQRGGKR
jgi:hypothetical protein